MQEEIESRTVALTVSTVKLTGRVFRAAICKYLEHRKNKQREGLARNSPVIPHGKQSVKQLIGQNQGVSTIESNDPHIRNFEKIARKYGVDYAIKRVKTEGKPKYVIFFKARDADALTQAFTEYTRKSAEREKKPSVRKVLQNLIAKSQNKERERTKDRNRSAER
ncbi:MAG: PcfB family protein [Clostridia bacterium]|nr:PcfB family protein [Clostridia bacterium]